MKAIRIHERGGPEVMTLEDLEIPPPRPGEVLIKVRAAGVNQADLGQRTGNYPNLLALPLTLGYEVAGTVAGVGPGVETLPIGSRVVSHVEGGYAEYAVARADEISAIPDTVDFGQATAAAIQGQTAYLLLTEATRLRAGETVLVQAAAGGVGSLAVQVARLLGAGTVLGTGRSAAALNRICELGADAAIDISRPDWIGQVLRATGGRGVDVVLECIGGPVGQQSLQCLAPFGRLAVFGALSGQMTPLVGQQLIRGCHSVVGFNTPLYSAEKQVGASHALLDYIASGKLRVTVSTYLLEQAAAAHQAIVDGKHSGKVVLTTP